MRVAVIGAGPAGLVTCKTLLEHDCDQVVVLECSDHVGGLWHYVDDPTQACVYASVRTNTFKVNTSFSGAPMPEEYPAFPSRQQLQAYLEAYTRLHSLYDHIRFKCRVLRVAQQPREEPQQSPEAAERGDDEEERGERMKWVVTWCDNNDVEVTESFDAVAVCNGHHRKPIPPNEKDFPGCDSFTGLSIHSKNYRIADVLRGKRVLVVGLGISGSEIFQEAATVASEAVGCSRRITTSSTHNPSAHGNESEATKGIKTTAYVNSIKAATIRPKIQRIKGSKVHFIDGTSFKAQVIVWCTGFAYDFPFLSQELLPILDTPSRVELFKHVFAPHIGHTLAFIGLPSVDGSLHPIMEHQAQWFARLLQGHCTLPSMQHMVADVAKWRDALTRYGVRYRPMQVKTRPYCALLDELMGVAVPNDAAHSVAADPSEAAVHRVQRIEQHAAERARELEEAAAAEAEQQHVHETMMKEAAREGRMTAVRQMVTEFGMDPALALPGAAGRGHVALVAYLVDECGADPIPGLQRAASGRRMDVVRYLIENVGAPLDAVLPYVRYWRELAQYVEDHQRLQSQ